MISDVLSDAESYIEDYRSRDPEFYGAVMGRHIQYVLRHMAALRIYLDRGSKTGPAPVDEFFRDARENYLRIDPYDFSKSG